MKYNSKYQIVTIQLNDTHKNTITKKKAPIWSFLIFENEMTIFVFLIVLILP